jgi:hypothetical protein
LIQQETFASFQVEEIRAEKHNPSKLGQRAPGDVQWRLQVRSDRHVSSKLVICFSFASFVDPIALDTRNLERSITTLAKSMPGRKGRVWRQTPAHKGSISLVLRPADGSSPEDDSQDDGSKLHSSEPPR